MRTSPKPTATDWGILAKHGVRPENLTVGGSLDLSRTAITALPEGLTVGEEVFGLAMKSDPK